MELKRELREELKEVLREWLPNRVWSEDELYPFNDLSVIEGIETFGETVTFNSKWVSEGLWFQTNINPTIQRDGFRVVFRWKGLEAGHE